MHSSNNFFYINGDSWLSHHCCVVANSEHPLFKNKVVINNSVPGSGNLGIIKRTKHALGELKKHDIYPTVCIGLTEVGRDFTDEFSLTRPQDDISEYLKSVLLKEIEILEDLLRDYKHYISTSWTTNPNQNKSLINFIEEDFDNNSPVYTMGNGIYSWLDDRKKIFKFSKKSFVEAIENKNFFQDKLLKNKYIDKTLHLDKLTSRPIYEKYFEHVLNTIYTNYENK